MNQKLERSEFLFLYQVRDCNPNGDPLEENHPRVDPETGVLTVSDVRIKRTIRDYWKDVLGRNIWIRNGTAEDGTPETAEQRRAELERTQPQGSPFRDWILKQCIDARVFGCIISVTKKGKGKGRGKSREPSEAAAKDDGDRQAAVTGPVQFSMFNRSLHRVAVQVVQGTAAFASAEGSGNKSFRTDHVVPYALIAVHGVLNDVAAAGVNMTAEDRELLLEGLWRGTELLHSRSKFGHQPLALLELASANGHVIGDLPGRLKLVPETGREDVAIRSVEHYAVDASALASAIAAAAARGRLSRIRWRHDPRLSIRAGEGSFVEALASTRLEGGSVDVGAFAAW